MNPLCWNGYLIQTEKRLKEFLDSVVDNFSDQKEFHQAVEEVIHSIWNTAANNEEYCKFNIPVQQDSGNDRNL